MKWKSNQLRIYSNIFSKNLKKKPALKNIIEDTFGIVIYDAKSYSIAVLLLTKLRISQE
jgi:hypothetical protein